MIKSVLRRFLCWVLGHKKTYIRNGWCQTDFDVQCERCDKYV